MRRILITDSIRNIAKEYADNLFKNKNANFKMPEANLKQFADDLKALNETQYAEYIEKIIEHYSKILTLEPNEFDEYKKRYFSNISDDALKQSITDYDDRKAFYEIIVDKMRYDDVQKKEIRPYMKRLGIKACVYCNASYTIATDNNKATYQLDHSYPKSKYPFLCTSFFNLQPSCMHCNQMKSDNDTYKYCMYTDNYKELDPFYFSITPKSIIEYMLNHDSDILQFELKSYDHNKTANKHKEAFGIEELYAGFTDAAEEIVWKGKTFNVAYREQLKKMFKEKFPINMEDFKRFYLGFYPDPKDVNKRPLTLLMQGIAKDMGLE